MIVNGYLSTVRDKHLNKEIGAYSEFILSNLNKEITYTNMSLDTPIRLSTDNLYYLKPYEFENSKWYQSLCGSPKAYIRVCIFALIPIVLAFVLDGAPLAYLLILNLILIISTYPPNRARMLLRQGIEEYNRQEYSNALNSFKQSQKLIPNLANELNDYVLCCLIKTSAQKNDILEYIKNNFPETRRGKTFFYLIGINAYEEAITYFNNEFTLEEIEKAPGILFFPLSAYKSLNTKPEIILSYIESKYHYSITRMSRDDYSNYKKSINTYTYKVYEYVAKCYQELGDKENLKNIYIKMHEFNPEDIVVSERLKKLIQEESL